MLALIYQHTTLVGDREPNRYHRSIQGTVRRYLGDTDRLEKVGNFSVVVIDVEAAINEGERMFDLFDCSSQTVDFFGLYDRNMAFVPKVAKALGDDFLWRPNLLVLDRLEILPRHRGKGYGLAALRWMVFHFGTGCGLAVMKPFPLQFEGGTPEERQTDEDFIRLRLGDFPIAEEAAFRKLQAYYGRAGFVTLPRTKYMVADPSRVALR